MTQPTEANSKIVDKAGNFQLGDRGSAIVSITDTTGGSVTNAVDDASASIKDDTAALAAKINEILAVLRLHGLIAD